MGSLGIKHMALKFIGHKQLSTCCLLSRERKKKVLEFYRMWVFCQKYSFFPPDLSTPFFSWANGLHKSTYTYLQPHVQANAFRGAQQSPALDSKKEKEQRTEKWCYTRNHLVLLTTKYLFSIHTSSVFCFFFKWCFSCFHCGVTFNQSWRMEKFS